MNDKTTSVKIDDAATLDLVSQIKGLRKEANETQQQLEERYAAEAKALDDAFAKRHEDLWAQLYAKTGLDPEGNYTLDTAYINDHGVAYIKVNEQCSCGEDHDDDGPGAALARLLGGALGGNVRIVGASVEAAEEEPEPTLN